MAFRGVPVALEGRRIKDIHEVFDDAIQWLAEYDLRLMNRKEPVNYDAEVARKIETAVVDALNALVCTFGKIGNICRQQAPVCDSW